MAERRKSSGPQLRRELHQDINDIRKEIQEINRLALKEGRRDEVIRITPRALRERLRVILGGQSDALLRSARKRLGGIRRGKEIVEEYIPPTTNVWDTLVRD